MIAADRPVQRPGDARLLIVDAEGHITHAPRSRFVDFLGPGDLVIANDAATLPASLHGVHLRSRSPVEVRLAGRASLADPTRRAVLERLGRRGTATISELAEPFGISLTGMKKHVLVLEDAGLVLTEKVGRARRCTLAPYAFEGITVWLQRLDRFTQVVERTKGER